MLALTETDSTFAGLSNLYKQQVASLFQDLALPGTTLLLPSCSDASLQGMDINRTWLVKEGMLASRCQDKRLITWDEGDLVLPDAGGHLDRITYFADGPVELVGHDTLSLMQTLMANSMLMRRWLRIVMLEQALLKRLLAAHLNAETVTTPGFVHFRPGEIIIEQNDSADAVFSLFEGSCEVLVNNVVVGELKEGEIIGALAVLTETPRSATVRAKTRCSMVKVPREQFSVLIRSNPTMIQRLLTDMATQIQKMNAQVVSLTH